VRPAYVGRRIYPDTLDGRVATDRPSKLHVTSPATRMRPLIEVLKQESPISLAREAVRRACKEWNKKRILAQLNEELCPVTFRDVPYYNWDASVFGEESRMIIEAIAHEICEGRFPFLGYGTVNLGSRPKWNVDFVSGASWPSAPLENRDCLRFDGSDVKVPYELSRLQFLPVLGKAHILSGDERYRLVAKTLLSHWIEDNPVGVGVNWSLPMEAALRGMSICFLLNLLSPLRPQEEEWLAAVTRSLWQHVVYIEANIEFSYIISSNHYLSNILGLYFLSSFLEGGEMAGRREAYRQRVEAEILRQVYDDGGDYEASTGYQVLVTQMFTSAYLLMRACGATPDRRFLERLRSMHRFMATLASSSGELPHLGDCDDGRVELLLDDLKQMLLLRVPERNSLRISNLLSLGACLFGGSSGDAAEDAKWYGVSRNANTAPLVVSKTDSVTPQARVFRQSGIAIASNACAEILFFAVRNGIYGKGSHNHNDKLSFVLRLDGEEVLCDSGTATYTRDPTVRNQFRVTAAHNTIVVDGDEQNTIRPGSAGLFNLGSEAEVGLIEQGERDGDLCLRASHSGYRSVGVTHTRTIRLSRTEDLVVVDDLLEGSGIHRFEINFQLAPKWTAGPFVRVNSDSWCRIDGPRNLEIMVSAPVELRAEQCESLISRTYGSTTSALRLRFSGRARLPVCLTTKISWASQSANTISAGARRSHTTNSRVKECNELTS
jgi:hypothetical protein